MTSHLLPNGTSLRRALLCAVVAVAAGGITAPAFAQTTIRFQPDPFAVPYNGEADLTIVLQNVPAQGLKGFNITFTIDPAEIVTYVGGSSGVLDPNLLAAWGGSGSLNKNVVSYDPGGTLTWEARSYLSQGGPSGTVVLGKLRFRGQSPSASGSLAWTLNTYIAVNIWSENLAVPNRLNAVLTSGVALSDLEIVSCSHSSPADPNTFVDGDTITLDCEIRNNGPASLQSGFAAKAVISTSQSMSSSVAVIEDTSTGGILPAGGSVNVNFSGAPVYTTPGSYYICTMADSDRLVFETNETNNVLCRPLQILYPFRNLQIESVGAAPDPRSDPNAIHVGGLFEVSYGIKSAGIAILRRHNNQVYLSTDENLDGGDTLLCQKPEGDVPGIPGGGVRAVAYGTDPNATAVTGQKCRIPFAQPPGNYYVIVKGDASSDIVERDANGISYENDNAGYAPMVLEGLLPSEIAAANPNSIGDRNAKITGPGKGYAFFVVVAIRDIAGYQMTVNWSDPNIIAIETPATDIVFSGVLEETGRTQTCTYSNLDNSLGRVTLSCTTTGSGSGPDIESSDVLVSINFRARRPGSGSLTLTNVSATNSTGAPISVNPVSGTYTVSGFYEIEFRNTVTPSEFYPGLPFPFTYDICNVGYGDAPVGLRTNVIISQDAIVDPNGTDTGICSFTETTPIPAFECATRNLDSCRATSDLRPGNYTSYIGNDPNNAVYETLPLPSRVFAIRKKGSRKSLESTGAPAGVGGSTGPAFGLDASFKATTVAALKSAARNLNFLAGRVTKKRSRELYIMRTLNILNQELDSPPLTRLRLYRQNRAALGGADIDGDGEDELLLLSHMKAGDYLEFRHIDYTKRKPILGVKVAITDFFADRIVDAAGVQFDGDPEDEIAVVTEDSSGSQSLWIYDVGTASPPALSTLTLRADDSDFGSSSDRVESICVMDHGLDGTEDVVTLNNDGTGAQSLRVYLVPATTGGDTGPPVADDAEFGGTPDRPKVLSIACTR